MTKRLSTKAGKCLLANALTEREQCVVPVSFTSTFCFGIFARYFGFRRYNIGTEGFFVVIQGWGNFGLNRRMVYWPLCRQYAQLLGHVCRK